MFSQITVAVFERVVHQGGAPAASVPARGPAVGSSLVMAATVTSIRIKILIWTLILTDQDHLFSASVRWPGFRFHHKVIRHRNANACTKELSYAVTKELRISETQTSRNMIRAS